MERTNYPTNDFFTKRLAKGKARLTAVLAVYSALALILFHIKLADGGLDLMSVGITVLILALAHEVWRGKELAVAIFAGTAACSAAFGAMVMFSGAGILSGLAIILTVVSAAMLWLLIRDDSVGEFLASQRESH